MDPSRHSVETLEFVPAAYVRVGAGDWLVLSEAGVAPLPGEELVIRGEPRTHEGHAYALTEDQSIVELRPSGPTEIEGSRLSDISVREFTIGADSTFWALTDRKVLHYTNETWTEIPFDVGRSGEQPTGLAVDAMGAPWVSTKKTLYRRRGNTWNTVAFPNSDSAVFLQGLTNAPWGTVYLPFRGNVVEFDGEAAKVAARPPEFGTLGDLRFAVGPDATHFAMAMLPTGPDPEATGAVLFAPTHRVVRSLNVGRLTSAAVDGQGRLWLLGTSKLVVRDPDGGSTAYSSSSLGGLSSTGGTLVVTGRGPELPEP